MLLVALAVGAGLQFKGALRPPPDESLGTAPEVESRPDERSTEQASGGDKHLESWARKVPLREAQPDRTATAQAGRSELPAHEHFDDLPVPAEEDLASVQPNLTLPGSASSPDELREPQDSRVEPQLPPERPHRTPQWLAYAVEPELNGRGPMVAIVIDDVGVNQQGTARAVDLPAPLTLAFIPYGYDLEGHTRRARQRGHELLVHMPMEPSSKAADPGPNALLTSLEDDEIMRRFRWGLSRFDGYVGVSNHMGSRFMARGDLVKPLLDEVERRGLLFLDSWTRADTSGTGLARRMNLPNARRDVFLDNEQSEEAVSMRLGQLEALARKKGYAVGLGHPHPVTLDVLARWIPQARSRGVTMVPISTVVRLEYGEGLEQMLAAAASGGEANRLLGGAE